MKPEHTVKGGVHTLLWTEDNVRATVSRIREDSRYNVHADVLIRLDKSNTPHIHEARMLLSGTGSRRTVANQCRDRVNSVDWPGIIEDMCVLVIRQHREGDPPIKVATIEAPPDLRYQIYPLLLQQQPTLMHGDGGSGKSTLAQYLSVIMDVGVEHGNLRVEPANTLYLDWETDPVDFKQRILAIQKGLGVSNEPDIWYRFCMQPLAGDIEAIQKIVVDNFIEAVVVDSVGPACGGDLNDAQPIMALFDAIRTLKVTALLIDHNNKEGKLYGNVYKTNRARLVWEVKKSQEAGSPNLALGVYDRKRNRGMLQKPLGFSLDFTEDAVTFSRVDVVDVPVLARGMPWADQFKAVLKSGAMTFEELVDEVEAPPEKHSSMKTVLYRNKAFVRTPDGKWGLYYEE